MGLLVADNVRKVYGGRAVVQGVSLQVARGQITGLLGANGAGKTTTFYMVVGAVQPNGGRILLDDQDITRLPMHERARQGIGYLAQEASIFRDLTVWDNVMAILEFRGMTRAERDRRAAELLDELSLTHVKDSLGRALSGGERRRAEIARTLASDPKFILLDEPFAGVDPIAVGEIQRIVAYLKGQGLGILITDHDVRATLSICDHTYVMAEGKIMVEGGIEDIVNDPRAREVYLGDDFEMPTKAAVAGGPAKPRPHETVEMAAPRVEGVSPSAEDARRARTQEVAAPAAAAGAGAGASAAAAAAAGAPAGDPAGAGRPAAAPARPAAAPARPAAPEAAPADASGRQVPRRWSESSAAPPAPAASPAPAAPARVAWPPEPGRPLLTPEQDVAGAAAEPPGGARIFAEPATGTDGIPWPKTPDSREGS